MAGEFTHQRPQRPATPPPEHEAAAPPAPPAAVLPIEERLERLQRERALREERQSSLEKERRAEVLELESRLAATHGVRGEDFEIVDGGKDGPIGLAINDGTGVSYKSYRAKVRRDADKQEDLIAFVRPHVVHPSKERFDEITRLRGFILDRCGAELLALCGGWEDRTKGKS